MPAAQPVCSTCGKVGKPNGTVAKPQSLAPGIALLMEEGFKCV